MKKTIIPCIVAVLCTVAICCTAVFCFNSYKAANTSVKSGYLTESEAAEYLGIDESRLVILRKNLKYLEGSYMLYSFVNDKGEEVSVCMYSKAQLDKVMDKMMDDSKTNSINFKYIEEALKEAETKAAS